MKSRILKLFHTNKTDIIFYIAFISSFTVFSFISIYSNQQYNISGHSTTLRRISQTCANSCALSLFSRCHLITMVELLIVGCWCIGYGPAARTRTTAQSPISPRWGTYWAGPSSPRPSFYSTPPGWCCPPTSRNCRMR